MKPFHIKFKNKKEWRWNLSPVLSKSRVCTRLNLMWQRSRKLPGSRNWLESRNWRRSRSHKDFSRICFPRRNQLLLLLLPQWHSRRRARPRRTWRRWRSRILSIRMKTKWCSKAAWCKRTTISCDRLVRPIDYPFYNNITCIIFINNTSNILSKLMNWINLKKKDIYWTTAAPLNFNLTVSSFRSTLPPWSLHSTAHNNLLFTIAISNRIAILIFSMLTATTTHILITNPREFVVIPITASPSLLSTVSSTFTVASSLQ